MRCARPSLDAHAQHGGWGCCTRWQCQQKHRSSSPRGCQAEPPGRRQVHLSQQADSEGQRPRPEAFLQSPERIGCAPRLDGDQPLGGETEIGEASTMEPAMLVGEGCRTAPEHWTRAFSLRRAASGISSSAARRETDGEGEGRRPVAVSGWFEFMDRTWIEAAEGKSRVQGRFAEGPAFAICGGKVKGWGEGKRIRRGGVRQEMRAHLRGQAEHLRAAGNGGRATGKLRHCSRSIHARWHGYVLEVHRSGGGGTGWAVEEEQMAWGRESHLLR